MTAEKFSNENWAIYFTWAFESILFCDRSDEIKNFFIVETNEDSRIIDCTTFTDSSLNSGYLEPWKDKSRQYVGSMF